MIDAEDRLRLGIIEDHVLQRTLNALRCVPRPFYGRDAAFLRGVLGQRVERLSERQRDHLKRVAWRLRRYLPPAIAPRVNPDDPIVREIDRKELENG